jgi:hypothetical protein
LTAQGDQKSPCERTFDAELQMVTYSAPEGLVTGQRSCLEGTHHNARRYMKLNEDGSIKFTVTCSGTAAWGTPIDRSDKPPNALAYQKLCRMIGYFGNWPFEALIQYRHRRDWADTFDRIQTFLAKVATEKTGPGESS